MTFDKEMKFEYLLLSIGQVRINLLFDNQKSSAAVNEFDIFTDNIGYGQIYLKTDVETAVIRNKQRHFSGVGEKTIPQMAERFEIPDCEKYTWETNTLILKDFQDVNE